MAALTLTPEQIAQLTAGNGQPVDKKTFVDAVPKPGALQRTETLEIAWTTQDAEGNKVWAKATLPRRISRALLELDGSTRGGGNATYSTQTPGGGMHLPFGLDTEFRVGGVKLTQQATKVDAEDKSIQRRENLAELAFKTDGTVGPIVAGVDADDIYKVRALVTSGKNPFYVKITAQHKANVGFNGLTEELEYEPYEG